MVELSLDIRKDLQYACRLLVIGNLHNQVLAVELERDLLYAC